MDSFVIVISRLYPIKQCLEAIERAEIPRKELKLLLYIDTRDIRLIGYCYNWLEKYINEWGEIIIKLTGKNPIDVKDFQNRWQRIIKNMEWIRNYTKDSEIVFMVEDDTVIPADAFKKLYKQIKDDKQIGCIQGVESLRGIKRNCSINWCRNIGR